MQTIKTKELLNQLVKAMPGLADKKDYVKFYEMFSFHQKEIVTYNEQVSVRVPVELDLECSVSAKEFHDLIAKINSETIDIGMDNNQLTIKAPRLTAKMNVSIKDITASILNATETGNLVWKPLPEKFTEAISLCTISITKTSMLDWMNTLTIDGANMLSADGYRISNYVLTSPLDGKYHLPVTAIEGAADQEFTEYSSSKQWFHLRAEDGLIYSCKRVVLENMPDLLKFFNTTGTHISFPPETDRIIDLVSVISEAPKTDKRSIAIDVGNNMMKFHSQRQDLGWVEQELPIEYSGQPITFYINPDFIKRIMKETHETLVGDKYCTFIADNFRHLVATCVKETRNETTEGSVA